MLILDQFHQQLQDENLAPEHCHKRNTNHQDQMGSTQYIKGLNLRMPDGDGHKCWLIWRKSCCKRLVVSVLLVKVNGDDRQQELEVDADAQAVVCSGLAETLQIQDEAFSRSGTLAAQRKHGNKLGVDGLVRHSFAH